MTGLKVIDGTSSEISRYLRERKVKKKLYFCIGCRQVHYDDDFSKEDGEMEAFEYRDPSGVPSLERFECNNCVYTLPFGFENYLPQLNHLIIKHAQSS